MRDGFHRLQSLAFVAIGAAAIGSPSDGRADAATWNYASTAGFPMLATGVSGMFDFQSSGDLRITRTTEIAGTGMSASIRTVDFSTSSPWNPAWIAGVRSLYQVEYDDETSGPEVSYEFNFAGGLPTSSYLVFADLDHKERVGIAAYDLAGDLIPFEAFAFVRQNGNQPGGDSLTSVHWEVSQPSRLSGRLRSTEVGDYDDPVVTLQSSVVIGRLEYHFDLDHHQSPQVNVVAFNFAGLVPTPIPGGFGWLGGGLAALASQGRLRRRGGFGRASVGQ
jgi:hypothetical protein